MPLLGTVLTHDEDSSPEEIEALRGAGYRTLKVKVGFDVAGDVGNLHELVVAARAIDTAGEMNGFLKPSTRLLASPYGVVDGSSRSPRGYAGELDWERVAAHTVDRLELAPAVASI